MSGLLIKYAFVSKRATTAVVRQKEIYIRRLAEYKCVEQEI